MMNGLLAPLCIVALLAAVVPACWSDAADETQTQCAAGYGGDYGAGGEGGGGFGGSEFGTGVGGSDVGTSAGVGGSGVGVASSSSDASVGAGGFSARPVPHGVRRRHRRLKRGHYRGDGPLGVAQEAICPQSPCFEQCDADNAAAAAVCAMIQDDAQRTACQNNAYANYKSCRANCASTDNTDCDDKYQDCVNNAPSSCLKRSGGKTLCQRCWEQCNAGSSPSSACRTCLF